MSIFFFDCACELCKDGKDDDKYDQACKSFEKLSNEAEKMRKACLQLPSPHHHIIRRRIVCYKEMYKIAKEHKASPMFLLHQVLKQGLLASVEGLLDAESQELKNEFRKDCQIFTIASGKIHELLNGSPSYVWEKTVKFLENTYDETIERLFLN